MWGGVLRWLRPAGRGPMPWAARTTPRASPAPAPAASARRGSAVVMAAGVSLASASGFAVATWLFCDDPHAGWEDLCARAGARVWHAAGASAAVDMMGLQPQWWWPLETRLQAKEPLQPGERDDLSMLPSPERVIMRFGYPSSENVRVRYGHVVSYNRRLKTANWVAEHLDPERLRVKAANRRDSQFEEDTTDRPPHRALLSDYRRSGFDRGHLAPAGDHGYSQKAMNSTFFLSNMSPQQADFNRKYWSDFEQFVRGLGAKHRNVWVLTGPLFLAEKSPGDDKKMYVRYQVIGTQHVAVPTHFFKCVLVETHGGDFVHSSFVMPNVGIAANTPFQAFRVPLEFVEKFSGLTIFDRLDGRDKCEGSLA